MGFVDLIKGSRSSYRVGQTTLVNSLSEPLHKTLLGQDKFYANSVHCCIFL